jgi:hypothetical protein
MNFEIALTKDAFRETLMNIIEESKLNDSQEETLKGLLHLEGELNVENKDLFCKDVDYSLSLCIKLLREIETSEPLNEEVKKEFDEICNRILQAQEIECSKHINIGKLVICDGLPYQVCEIDYEDFSVKLCGSDELDGGFWESPLNCKSVV